MESMKIEARVDSNHLVVEVTFESTISEPLYLRHWLSDWYGLLGIPEMNATTNPKTAGFTRELAYACTGAPGELVLLNADGPSFPPGIAPARPRVPESTRLLPGARVSWKIRLPLPMREWHAYEPPRDQPTRRVSADRVRYKLEAIRESQCRHRPVKEFVNFPGVFQARGIGEEYEASAALAEPIVLLQRTDAFERFG